MPKDVTALNGGGKALDRRAAQNPEAQNPEAQNLEAQNLEAQNLEKIRSRECPAAGPLRAHRSRHTQSLAGRLFRRSGPAGDQEPLQLRVARRLRDASSEPPGD